MTGERKSVRARICGQVQGVGYRDWAMSRASHHGLDGWVRNKKDGTVEALFSGAPEHVQQMLAEVRIGPRAAEVTKVEATDDIEEGARVAGRGFTVRTTN